MNSVSEIHGNIISLIPATLADRRNVYDWCFQSETTKSHSGPPDYPDIPIPSYEEFYASDSSGYEEYFFTGAKPQDGRGFIITYDGEPVGFISYTSFHMNPQHSELDIWMNCEANCGKGFGTDALVALGDFLNKTMGINELIIAPSRKNKRAVKSYKKAGFKESAKPMRDYLLDEYKALYGDGDYGVVETMILSKRFESKY